MTKEAKQLQQWEMALQKDIKGVKNERTSGGHRTSSA
jgi:hypothetical protein